MSEIVEAIGLWREKKINGTQLMRSIVNYPHWQMPISEAAALNTVATNELSGIQFNRDPLGVNRLMLWSSDETSRTWALGAKLDKPQHILKTSGTFIFSLDLGGQIDEIWIDPLNAHDILYTKAQFQALRDMALAIPIEKDLAELRAGTASPGACIRVREYKNFMVPVVDDPAGRYIIFAPDEQHRSLAAVFTADDAYDGIAEYAKANARGHPVQCMQFDGVRLFGMLSKMDLTGIVFNCKGPITPVAFAAPFSQVVLEA